MAEAQAKGLVIVESPAKARTLQKILGAGFRVKASVGHVKDLPQKEMGVDTERDFAPKYVVIPGKEKVLRELRAAARAAHRVYLAPDPDREGEAIAYHIATEIAQDKESLNGKVHRISFHEITARAVKEAIKRPGKIDMAKVNAQQARRVLDRLVGYGLSPLLWRKVRRGLSAGRVQSVAVRLVVDREREIQAFKPQEYWSVEAKLSGAEGEPFQGSLHSLDGQAVIDRARGKFLLQSAPQAQEVVVALREGKFLLQEVQRKKRRRLPLPPFITSTLQQEAFQVLGFSAKRTMTVAQQLYEGVELPEGSVGLITYMRTDSVRVAPEAQAWARQLIQEQFGKEYLPTRPPQYKSKPGAQEAHEAIRPTYPDKPPEAVRPYLQRDQYQLYSLIWRRFLQSQMAPAEFEQTTFIIQALPKGGGQAQFRASGSVLVFSGFLALYKEALEAEEGLLPALKEGQELRLLELRGRQHFTQPPPRYSEATLVKALEEKGIGRPSTYASILSTIQERRYVRKEGGRLRPTELGMVVNDLLVERFPELMDVSFTARMEEELDQVEEGRLQWVEVVREFYRPFSHELAEAMRSLGKLRPKDVPTDEMCPQCGSPVVKRWGRHGWFLACSAYPRCKHTHPLETPKAEPTEQKCPQCGSPMVLRQGRFGQFLACSRYPQCKGTKALGTGVKCPLDGGEVLQKRTRRGRVFFSCSNYPKCKFATWQRPVAKACPRCGSPYMLQSKRQGKLLLSCPRKDCPYQEPLLQDEQA